MVLSIVQKQKELFSACFNICSQQSIVGKLEMTGHLGSMEVYWKGKFIETEFEIYFDNHIKTNVQHAFRPYKIVLDNIKGCIYQTFNKQGLFSRYDYVQACLDGVKYDLYPIGFGQNGSKNPVFCDEQQIALVEKDCTVYNDLHEYHITTKAEKDAIITIYFCCYMFTNACYKPGKKFISSVEKVTSTTKNKLLLSKYDPQFKETYHK